MKNLKDLLSQAQKIDADLRKAHEGLAQEQFQVTKNGLVTLTFYGDRNIKDVEITEEGLFPENKELLEETLKITIREILEHIKKAEEDINLRIVGSTKIESFL